ncbi:AraC family transcriptional regulator [Undibacterium sp. TJN19]|uniref:AraC family transcriptional regulator n=1 Tax=Undibacterium sp. TJN19 TaxID=3413055 RepID=UPI003BF45712
MIQKQFKMLACRMDGVEAIQAHSSLSFARHIHDQFGIGVISHGAQKSLSGRGMVEAIAGDVITVNPGEIHDGTPIGESGRAWNMLYFEPSLIAGLLADISEGKKSHGEFTQPVIQDAAIAQCVQRLFSVMTAGPHHSSALQLEELMLLLFAGTALAHSDKPCTVAVPGAIVHARNLIDDNPGALITLSDLANESGLSRFQLIRAFAKATGFTPHAYLLQRRIHLARRLIADGSPLVDVAMASGFADQSHMTRLFVKNYGISPGAYATLN